MNMVNRKLPAKTCVLAVMLLIYFGAVYMVNLGAPPGFYDSDMYTDIRYAMEAWKDKSIFPEGWVFGNQLYVVSTPVLAALLYGLTGTAHLAMGLASTIMSVFVLLSFDWMVRPAIRSREGRLAGAVLFLGLVLFFGDAWHETGGWQLLFTMCSYYSCYAITAFLAFGCWIRRDGPHTGSFLPVLVLTCLMSFGTGIQSIRQTAVMTLPLMTVEFLKLAHDLWRKNRIRVRSVAVTGVICAANLLGVVTARCLDPEQVEIIGEMNPVSPSAWLQNLRMSLLSAMSLVMNYDVFSLAVLAGLVLLCLGAVLGILMHAIREEGQKPLLLLGVLAVSILAILAADTLTTMQVRPIYYFMLFPMIAFLAAWLCTSEKKGVRGMMAAFLAVVFTLSCSRELPGVFHQVANREEDPALEVSEFLVENGYTTLYGAWNQGADVAVASDWSLSAGFWEYEEDPFFYYKYLCNPEIFRADSETCAYLFYGEENVRLAVEKSKTKNIEMTFLHYFPDSDIYLYTAEENIMEAFW